MIREDAIKRLKLWLICSEEYTEDDVSMNEAIRIAINSLEQEPCEDAVSRKAINNLRKYNLVGGISTISLKDINKLPSVKPQEPKIGHWIIDGHHRRCPKCDEYFCTKDAEGNEIPSSFCPNCGAKMEESEE